MPKYKCINKECENYEIWKTELKSTISYDRNMNRIDSAEICPKCGYKRAPEETPMPENLTFKGVMKYK